MQNFLKEPYPSANDLECVIPSMLHGIKLHYYTDRSGLGVGAGLNIRGVASAKIKLWLQIIYFVFKKAKFWESFVIKASKGNVFAN